MHKFISNHSSVRFQEVIYCEKCGLISYHANDSDKAAQERTANINPVCPADSSEGKQ